jgi:hypothetical protein
MSTQSDPGVASWTLTAPNATNVVMGAPVVNVTARTSGADAQLNVRLWELQSGQQLLIGRGAYRIVGTPSSTNKTFPVQLSGTAWQLAPGTHLKVEVTGYDAPTYAPDSIPAVTTIDAVDVRLPTTDLVAAGRGLAASAESGTAATMSVARFGDATTVNHMNDYRATITWGDGSSSTGTIANGGNGWLVVNGTHEYANPGSYETSTTIWSTVTGVTALYSGTASIKPASGQQAGAPCRLPHIMHCL